MAAARYRRWVPAVGDLHGVRGARADSFGVGAAAIAAYDLDARTVAQPPRQGLPGSIGQDLDWTPGLHVDEDRAVVVAPAQREVVDAEHRRDRRCRIG